MCLKVKEKDSFIKRLHLKLHRRSTCSRQIFIQIKNICLYIYLSSSYLQKKSQKKKSEITLPNIPTYLVDLFLEFWKQRNEKLLNLGGCALGCEKQISVSERFRHSCYFLLRDCRNQVYHALDRKHPQISIREKILNPSQKTFRSLNV